ncbi:hypothetical protein PR048_023730 [Dryococelus australis]|uniref:Reverse transcriptase domain-containing protein n=1 Tax=Dryococelus australis TaxID=614101 RepID=A0ABQ9GV39_9NEOP|nr:hypothetical protein PR048_023730 [Dryococelus australis]
MTVFKEVHYGFKWNSRNPRKSKKGVKQGDCLSLLLFKLALEKAIKRVAETETRLNILACTDDVVLIGKNKEELRDIMKMLINIEKTKYLPISRCHHVGPRVIDMDGVTLEKMEDFKYLGGLLNERNVMEKEILTRIQAIYKTIIQPVVLHVKEADEWRRRKNRELRDFYQLPDIVAVIKGQKLRWYGHIMRRDDDLVKDVVERGFEEKRPRGRPRLR